MLGEMLDAFAPAFMNKVIFIDIYRKIYI